MTMTTSEPIPPNNKILVNRNDAAALCSMAMSTFLRLVKDGKLPGACLGAGSRGARWSVEDLRKANSKLN